MRMFSEDAIKKVVNKIRHETICTQCDGCADEDDCEGNGFVGLFMKELDVASSGTIFTFGDK